MSNLNNDLTQQHTALTDAYTDMSPGHRSEVAQAFIDRFRQCDDPGAIEYSRMDPHYMSSSQLALMHQYAADVYPEILYAVNVPSCRMAGATNKKLSQNRHRAIDWMRRGGEHRTTAQPASEIFPNE